MSDGVEQRPGRAFTSRQHSHLRESPLCCGWGRSSEQAGAGAADGRVAKCRAPPDHWPWRAASGQGGRLGARTPSARRPPPLSPAPSVGSRAQAAGGAAGEVAAGPLSRQSGLAARGFSALGRQTMGQCEVPGNGRASRAPCGPMLRGEDGASGHESSGPAPRPGFPDRGGTRGSQSPSPPAACSAFHFCPAGRLFLLLSLVLSFWACLCPLPLRARDSGLAAGCSPGPCLPRPGHRGWPVTWVLLSRPVGDPGQVASVRPRPSPDVPPAEANLKFTQE